MKKSKLIVGTLLMILGLGVSISAVAFRYHEHGRYMNYDTKITNRRNSINGYRFGKQGRRWVQVTPNENGTTTPGSVQVQPPLPKPNQNREYEGGVNQ